MIAYVTVGSNDLKRSERFYNTILPVLGYELSIEQNGDLSYVLPRPAAQNALYPDFYVKSPFDGLKATAGNGTMVAFQARDQAQVRTLYAAALNAGGEDEGEPGFRSSYGERFYVGYLRDPDGNKVALFSENLNDPSRLDG